MKLLLGGPGRQVMVRLHHDRLIVVLGSDWVCQLPRAFGTVTARKVDVLLLFKQPSPT